MSNLKPGEKPVFNPDTADFAAACERIRAAEQHLKALAKVHRAELAVFKPVDVLHIKGIEFRVYLVTGKDMLLVKC